MDWDYVGRIRLDELIGKGGMGSVYKGYDEILGRYVALKKADRSSPGRIVDKMRFLREARALSRLNHPNICGIHDFIERPDADYLVLEYIAGRSLRDAMDEGDLTLEQKLAIAETMAEVLQATHEVNIVHRDLKPENVMITENGTIKVLDFGLARSLDDEYLSSNVARNLDMSQFDDDSWSESLESLSEGSATSASDGGAVGTLLYMSPEQANGEQGTTSSDMYSLGVILYALFAGKMPYRHGHSPAQLMFHVATCKTVPIERRKPDLDPDLARLITRLLSKREEDRGAAGEVLEAIRSIRQKPERIKLRRRLIIAGCFALMALAAAIFVTKRFSDVTPAESESFRVALLPFVNETGDPQSDWVTWGLRNMVAQELVKSDAIDVVNSDDTKRMLETLRAPPDPPRQDVLQNIADLVGANRTVRTVVRANDSGFLIRFTIYDLVGPVESSQVSAGSLTAAAQLLASAASHRLGGSKTTERDALSTWSDVPLVNQLKAMGDQFYMTSGPQAAVAFLQACTYLDPQFAQARLQLASYLVSMGELDAAKEHVREVLSSPPEELAPRTEMMAMRVLARILEKQGNLEESEEHYQLALEIGSKHDLPDNRADTLHGLATVKILKGDLEEAEQVIQEAIDLYESRGNHQMAIDVRHNLAVAVHDQGDLEKAERIYLDVLAASRDMDDLALTGKCHLNYGVLIWDRGDLDGAESHYLKALAIFQELKMPEDQATIYNNLAGVALYREDFVAAQGYFDRALAIHRDIGNALGQALTSWNVAELLAFQGKYEKAEGYLPAALSWYHDDYEVWYLKSQIDCHLGRQAPCVTDLEKTRALAGDNWNEDHQDLWDAFVGDKRD